MKQQRHAHVSVVVGNRKRTLSPGFTLIELLVVASIIMVITAVTMNGQSSFNKSLILANTAYDIALAFRSAETYGISSRVIGGVANAGYGIHIDSASPTSFVLFADTSPGPNAANCHGLPSGGASAPNAVSGDCAYSNNERVSDYTIGNSVYIADFCVLSLGVWDCTLDTLDVVFSRPNPDPIINGTSNGSEACISLAHPQGGSRHILIGASGAITANASSCP